MHKYFLTLLLGALLALPVLAQESSSYQYTVGFALEPVVVDEPNALLLQVIDRRGDVVSGLEEDLALQLTLRNIQQRLSLSPGSREGTYRADVIPTSGGAWEIAVVGDLDGVAVFQKFLCTEGDFKCPMDRETIGFPLAAPSSANLQKRLSELEVGVANATAADPMGFFGVIAGVLGLLAGGAALMKRKI